MKDCVQLDMSRDDVRRERSPPEKNSDLPRKVVVCLRLAGEARQAQRMPHCQAQALTQWHLQRLHVQGHVVTMS